MFDTLVQAPVDGQGVGSAGSRQTTSSPSSARAVGQLLAKADSEQYDPLFDSIEPSPNPLDKNNHNQKHMPTSDSNTMVRLSGSCEPLDVEENNKHTEVGPVASATSMDNDGYGETADAEVGVVEDESLSDDDGAANMAAGEIEIDQVKSTGKSKKKKDSRSTRLFKSAIADFVKDLLKPSWRQGNMSKEAFKTIVKKTVDKVSGAMKSHQIPKSQEKIDRYIDSSQRKLTKLVMVTTLSNSSLLLKWRGVVIRVRTFTYPCPPTKLLHTLKFLLRPICSRLMLWLFIQEYITGLHSEGPSSLSAFFK
jgi:hypothetical protein